MKSLNVIARRLYQIVLDCFDNNIIFLSTEDSAAIIIIILLYFISTIKTLFKIAFLSYLNYGIIILRPCLLLP